MKKLILGLSIFLTISSGAFGQQEVGIKAPTAAPDFVAKTYEGKQIRLSDYYQDGSVILVFYRGGWGPYCNRHLRQLQAELNKFKAYGSKFEPGV